MNQNIDRLSSLLERFRVRAHMFHNGPLCGVTHFAAQPGLGFFHVMRRGTMTVTHQVRSGAPRQIKVCEPSLLFYPRPLAHDFHNAPTEGADFTCATLAFDGGAAHPLARALPALIVLPLAEVDGIEHTLALLFSESERVQCGQRLLADRLFEVLLLQLLRWLLQHPQRGGVSTGLLHGLSQPRLSRALVAMHERPGEHWSLQGMAECAGMSRSAFAALFKQAVGDSPADYLAQWRLAIAQSEMQRGKPLKLIADELGYASAAALSRMFVQKVGMAPRAWLKGAQLDGPDAAKPAVSGLW
jgi:AraC-like DNA-binding protein